MKKQPRSAKKLTLTRETVANLANAQIVTGVFTDACPPTYTNRCSACTCTTRDC